MKGSIAGRERTDQSRDHTKRDKASRSIKDEAEDQLGVINGLVQRARCDGCKPSMSGMAAQLSAMHPAARREAAMSLQSARGNRFLQRIAIHAKAVQKPSSSEAQTGILQRSAVGSAPETVPPIVHEVLRSHGQSLDPAIRAFMESRFGHNFSQVRVHTNMKAAESARAVNATAYTAGCDLVFGPDQYKPWTEVGQKLLSHELAHVVQQHGAASTPLFIDPPSSPMELEAEAASRAISVGGLPLKVQVHGMKGLARSNGSEYKTASPNILQIMSSMGDELAKLRASAPLSSGPKEESVRTFCIIKVISQDGSEKQVAAGSYFGKGPHAEEIALRKLKLTAIMPTDAVLVMVDQYPCTERCTPALQKFRRQTSSEFRVFHRAKVSPVTEEGTRKAIRTPKSEALKPSGASELVELEEFHRPPTGRPSAKSGPVKPPVPSVPKSKEPIHPERVIPKPIEPKAAPHSTGSPETSTTKTPAAEIPSAKQTTKPSPSSIRPVAKPEISDTKRISPKVNVIDKKTGRVSISSGGAWKSARKIGTASSIALKVWGAYDAIDGALARIEKAQTGSVRPEVAMAMQAVKNVFPSAEDLWNDEFSSGQYDKLYPDARDWLYYNGIEALMVKGEMLSAMDYYLNILIRYYERLSSLEIYYGRYCGQAEPLYAEAKRRASILHEIGEEVLKCVPLMPSDTAQATLFGIYMTFYDAAGDMGQLESLLSGMQFEYGRGYNDARNKRIEAAKVWNYWYPGYAKVAKKHILRYILREH